jgi:UDP-N-acetylmuramoylalanine--D-glutamate ligase
MKHSPDISIITNLSPNHLDYHKGMEEYVEAKKNIYLHAKAGSVLVLNGENAVTKELGKDAPNGVEVRFFNNGYAKIADGTIFCNQREVLRTEDILIPGKHNAENYCGVICALDGIVSDETVREIARNFGGVEHRIELVRVLNGVSYYNSSIDSSPTRTAAALNSFKDKVIVICGGYDKNIPYAPLAQALCERAGAVVLTGATREKIMAALRDCPTYDANALRVEICPNFEEAVQRAATLAEDGYGENVLLSPACASFDAFVNFEARGRAFREQVMAMK